MKCLDSIVNQSIGDFQIVLVDDGSTDGSEKICDSYADKDTRIKVIHQKNRGLVNARKTGLKEADGDYIYYVDSDDWIDKNTIETFAEVLNQYVVDMVVIGCKREFENGKCFTVPALFEERFYNKRQIENKILPHIVNTNRFFEFGQGSGYYMYLINKQLLSKNLSNIDDRIRIGEDFACTYPCWLDANSVYIKNDIYYHYRQVGNSMKHTRDPKEYERLQLLFEVLINKAVQGTEREIQINKVKYLIIFNLLISTFDKLQSSDGLFPYMDFIGNTRVVVYGAGIFGNKIVEWLENSKYAKIVAWVDKNYKTCQNKGFIVCSPDTLLQIEYDYVILAVLKAEIREDIKQELKTYNIPDKKIIDIDLEKINNKILPIEFENILDNYIIT